LYSSSFNIIVFNVIQQDCIHHHSTRVYSSSFNKSVFIII
jgi:hypothetical protein